MRPFCDVKKKKKLFFFEVLVVVEMGGAGGWVTFLHDKIKSRHSMLVS